MVWKPHSLTLHLLLQPTKRAPGQLHVRRPIREIISDLYGTARSSKFKFMEGWASH